MSTDAPQKTLSRDELIDWLRLIGTDGIGPISFKQLLNKHGSAQGALSALASSSKTYTVPSADQIERELLIASRDGITPIPSCEATYPSQLRQVDDAPPVLWVIGDAGVLHRPCVGVVGARNASLNGKKFAKKLSHDLADAGYAVVSGLARGIDGAAHEGALAQGTTVAVLASGVDVVYPPEHRAIYQKIIKSGAVVSELKPGTEPPSGAFPPPQPNHFRPQQRGDYRRSHSEIGIVDNRTAGPRPRPRGLGRTGLAARSPVGRSQ